MVELSLPPDKYDYIVHHGIAASDELDLKPGKYILCVGIMDEGSKRIGTLHLPIQIASAEKAPSAADKRN